MDQPKNAPAGSRPPDSAPGDTPGAMQNDRTQAAPTQSEQDLWSGRMHWQNAIGRVFTWLLLNVAFIVVAMYAPRTEWVTSSRIGWIVAGLFAASSVFLLGGVMVRRWQTHYRLTSQRLFIERGILSRTMDQSELIRVDDVRMQQSFVNRIFNIGTVLLMTTDVTDRAVAIVGIKDPIRVTELIRQQMRTLRGKTLFVENV